MVSHNRFQRELEFNIQNKECVFIFTKVSKE